MLELVKWAHVLGAAVLIGTGAGLAFFMVMAHRSQDPAHIAKTAQTLVIADMLFTAPAALIQPVTGLILVRWRGWDLSEGWVLASLALYCVIGLCWLPVLWIQVRMRDLARGAEAVGAPLPSGYTRLYRLWFALGIPAFSTILLLLWLMVARPAI